MSSSHVHNNTLDPLQITPSTSSTTITSSASSASISQHQYRYHERSISISEKELELGLAAIEKEEKEGSESGDHVDNGNSATDTQKTHNGENFEVHWDGHSDPENPQNWVLWKRICIVVGVSFQTMVV